MEATATTRAGEAAPAALPATSTPSASTAKDHDSATSTAPQTASAAASHSTVLAPLARISLCATRAATQYAAKLPAAMAPAVPEEKLLAANALPDLPATVQKQPAASRIPTLPTPAVTGCPRSPSLMSAERAMTAPRGAGSWRRA